MEKKTKKPLTVQQQIKKNKVIGYAMNGGSIVSVLLPYIIMGSVNYEQWFYTENGWKVGLGGALALAIMGMATWIITANKEKQEKMTNGWITIIIGWFAVAFCFYLLGSIIDQIATIMLFGGIGLVGGYGFEIGSKQFKKKAELLKKASDDNTIDKAKEELKKEDSKYDGTDI